MSTDHRAATTTDRLDFTPAEYYLPAMPSETLVDTVQRLTDAVKRDT